MLQVFVAKFKHFDISSNVEARFEAQLNQKQVAIKSIFKYKEFNFLFKFSFLDYVLRPKVVVLQAT